MFGSRGLLSPGLTWSSEMIRSFFFHHGLFKVTNQRKFKIRSFHVFSCDIERQDSLQFNWQCIDLTKDLR
jgi:hypothetical protein